MSVITNWGMPPVHLWLNLCRLARCHRGQAVVLAQASRSCVWTDVGLLIVRVRVLLAGGPVIDRGISASSGSSLCADRQLSPERRRTLRRHTPPSAPFALTSVPCYISLLAFTLHATWLNRVWICEGPQKICAISASYGYLHVFHQVSAFPFASFFAHFFDSLIKTPVLTQKKLYY